MPLSLIKLQEFLSSKNFIVHAYFVLDGLCFYIELFHVKTSDIFLMYIPSKYEFSIPEGNNAYKISYINMGDDDNMVDDYAGESNIQAAYAGTNIQLSPDKEHLSQQLESNYRCTISLDSIGSEDNLSLRTIYRQIKRLRYCVENLKYKLGIIYKNYICGVRRDESISCFLIKHYPRNDSKKLMLIADLETLYEKDVRIMEDLKTVQDGIYRVLERNQDTHINILSKMTENKKDISIASIHALTKKTQLDTYISQLEQMLSIMVKAEEKTMSEIYGLQDVNINTGLHSDITRAHQRSRIEKELDKINYIKGEIIKNILTLREKRDNIILSIDKIMFDNTVMFDSIIKNFAQLKEI